MEPICSRILLRRFFPALLCALLIGVHAQFSSSESVEPEHGQYASPLVLDLDGDGIELTSLKHGSEIFDIDNDGGRERTGWIGTDDGFLAIDLNDNGKIDNAGELFGSGRTFSPGQTEYGESSLRTPGKHRIHFDSGFEKLASYDSNKDGIIDRRDPVFIQLSVWKSSQKGHWDVHAGVLHGLSELGISEIELGYKKSKEVVEGNLVIERSAYRKTNGEKLEIADVWFRFNQRNVWFDRPRKLAKDIQELPNLASVGRLKRLHTSMHENPRLKELVEEFSALTKETFYRAPQMVDDILIEWARTTAKADVPFRGNMVASRAVFFYEAHRDTPFKQKIWPNPTPAAGAWIGEWYKFQIRNYFFALFAQTELGQDLFPGFTFSALVFVNIDRSSDSKDLLARLEKFAPEEWSQRLKHYRAGLLYLDRVYLSFKDVKLENDKGKKYRKRVEKLLRKNGIQVKYRDFLTANLGTDKHEHFITHSRNSTGRYNGRLPVTLTGSGDDTVRLGGKQQHVIWGDGQGTDTLDMSRFEQSKFVSIPVLDLEIFDTIQDEVSWLPFTTKFTVVPFHNWNTANIAIRNNETDEELILENVMSSALSLFDPKVYMLFKNGERVNFSSFIMPLFLVCFLTPLVLLIIGFRLLTRKKKKKKLIFGRPGKAENTAT